MGVVTQSNPVQAAEGASLKPSKEPRPTQVIPTERITFRRQLDILRAFAAASGPGNAAITNKQVAEILKMAPATVSLANTFFIEVGLLVRGDGGLTPSPEVMDYHRAHQWNPDTAAHKLAGRLRESWFARALAPKLTFSSMTESEAINTLADASSAAPKFRSNLKLLIDYVEAAGIAERDGDTIKLAQHPGKAPAIPPDSSDRAKPSTTKVATAPRTAVTTAFTQPTEGVVQFHVSVKVDMTEFATWQPDRISAFFGGIAQVLSAKATVEQTARGE